MNGRALVIVLDSVGVGAAPDAASYGDAGADTLGHVLERCPWVQLPTLWSLGLGRVVQRGGEARGFYGRMSPLAKGKDSTTGHWELMGDVLREPLGLFQEFPAELVGEIERRAGVSFTGNKAASGTQILEELGEEHARTGKLILYTSADSVLQIAAHEELVPLERLYEVCQAARLVADRWRIGRVIARPFVGGPGAYVRTARRHDFSMSPGYNVLDALARAGVPVRGVGKVGDLFAGRSLAESYPTACNADGMQRTRELWRRGEGLLFLNLVDFDTLYGHRRDPEGYGRALAEFDAWLGGFLGEVRGGDLLIITADHGNDPTFHGTDHTREEVPVLVLHEEKSGDVGRRGTFADVGATIAQYFAVPWKVGTPIEVPAQYVRKRERGSARRPDSGAEPEGTEGAPLHRAARTPMVGET